MEKIIINEKQTDDSILVEAEIDELDGGRSYIECRWTTPAELQAQQDYWDFIDSAEFKERCEKNYDERKKKNLPT